MPYKKASRIALFSGRSNQDLARKMAHSYGVELGAVEIKDFADGEIYVAYKESIRGAEVYIVQSTPPPGDNWIELLLMIDAAHRASAARVTAVMPYFGYARQERKDQPRVSIAAKLMANMLATSGVNRVLTMDLHAPQIQGFFDVPVDHLYGSRVFADQFANLDTSNLVVVAPDIGALKMARSYSARLGAELAVVDKRRPRQNAVEVMNIIGDVRGKNVLLIDDLVDTAGTLTSGAFALKEAGALEIRAACTHPLLSGPALDRIMESPIQEMWVTDTIPLKHTCEKIKVVSVADIFADAIRRIYTDESVSRLF